MKTKKKVFVIVWIDISIDNSFVDIRTAVTIDLVPPYYSNITIFKSRKTFQHLLRHSIRYVL